MSQKRKTKQSAKEQLQRIIDLCHSVEEKGIDPFLVEVEDIIPIIHKHFPEWDGTEELCLDAEALHGLASAVKLQSDWVKHRTTSLYTDPFLIEEKLRRLANEEIAAIFTKSWHPILELEQISPNSLMEALRYWRSLVPLDQRWPDRMGPRIDAGATTREELARQQLIGREFSRELEDFWQELKHKAQGEEVIDYWDFVGASTYEETVKRAYLTSFLVTYGYATLQIDRLEEMIYIKPRETPVTVTGEEQATSLPIPVSVSDWKTWREGLRD